MKMGAYIHGVLILCGCLLSRFYSMWPFVLWHRHVSWTTVHWRSECILTVKEALMDKCFIYVLCAPVSSLNWVTADKLMSGTFFECEACFLWQTPKINICPSKFFSPVKLHALTPPMNSCVRNMYMSYTKGHIFIYKASSVKKLTSGYSLVICVLCISTLQSFHT